MSWRIAVNALTIDSRPSGGKTYLLNLLEEMTNLAGNDYRFYLLVAQPVADVFQERITARNTQLVVFPSLVTKPPFRIGVEQFILPIWLKSRQIDLLFAARNVMPILAPCPTVIGIHSMHLNYEQENLPWWRQMYGPTILKLSAKRADAYVAISEFAGRTFIEKYHLPANRLYIAPNGFKRKVSDYNQQDINPIGSEYLLFVSSLYPHKNVPFLIRVFADVVKARPSAKLIIVGRGDKGTLTTLNRQVQELGITDKIQFTGAISDDELIRLYRHARVFVFPSLIEGFGLTPLEAMAYSVPVVASNKTSIPEVVGDAGIILGPHDEGCWAEAILKILGDDGFYSELSKKAGSRAKLFTWRRAAEVALDSFQNILHGKREKTVELT